MTAPAAGLRGRTWGDLAFRGVLTLGALAVPVLLGFLVYELYLGAELAIQRYGVSFLTSRTWDPVTEEFDGRDEGDVRVSRRETGRHFGRHSGADVERVVLRERVPQGTRVEVADDRRPNRRQSTRSHFEPILPSFG